MEISRTMTVYGVAGAGHAVGATHFAVTLAAYLADVRHRKTSLLEWNESGDFAKIYAVFAGKDIRKPPPEVFSIQAVEYMPAAGRDMVFSCRERGREAVVIDFGVLREGSEEEFLRCDRRFILGGLNDWQVDSWPSTPDGEARQAAEVTEMYTELFQHPLVDAITTWDFTDGGWLKAPSGLIRADGTPKPAYQALKRLIHGEWETHLNLMTDADGLLRMTGFKGSYLLRSGDQKATFLLGQSASPTVLQLSK